MNKRALMTGLGCLLCISIRALPAVLSPIGNEYAYWSRFKPGTFVSFKTVSSASGTKSERIATLLLKDVRPDRVVLEQHESSLPSSGPSAALPGWLIEFKAAAYEGPGLLSGMLGVDTDRLLNDPEGIRLESRQDSVVVKGRSYPAQKTVVRFGNPDSPTTASLWTSEAIPGRLARFRREVRAGGTVWIEDASVIDFLSLRAGAAELEKLNSERPRAAVEVQALEFVRRELRLLEDYEALSRETADLGRALAAVVPGGQGKATDEAEGKLAAQMRKTADMKARFEADKKRCESLLDAGQRAKLKPFLDAAEKWMDVQFKMLGLFSSVLRFDPSQASAQDGEDMMDTLTALMVEGGATVTRFRAELQKLISAKLILIR